MAKKKGPATRSQVMDSYTSRRPVMQRYSDDLFNKANPESFYIDDYLDTTSPSQSYIEDTINRARQDGVLEEEQSQQLNEQSVADKVFDFAKTVYDRHFDVGRLLTHKVAETIFGANEFEMAKLNNDNMTILKINSYCDMVDDRDAIRKLITNILLQNPNINPTGKTVDEFVESVALSSYLQAKIPAEVRDLSLKMFDIDKQIKAYDNEFKSLNGRYNDVVRKAMYDDASTLSEHLRANLGAYAGNFYYSDKDYNDFHKDDNIFATAGKAMSNIIGMGLAPITYGANLLGGTMTKETLKNAAEGERFVDSLYTAGKNGGTSKIRERIDRIKEDNDRRLKSLDIKTKADLEFYKSGIIHPSVLAKSMAGWVIGQNNVGLSDKDLEGKYNTFKFYDPEDIDKGYLEDQLNAKFYKHFYRPDYWIPEVGSTLGMIGGTVGSMGTNWAANYIVKKLPVWLSKGAGPAAALTMGADVASGVFFTKRSRELETAGEAINGLATRIVKQLSEDGVEYNKIMNGLKGSLRDDFRIDTTELKPEEIILLALAYNVRLGNEYDGISAAAQDGLGKLINANNALAYSDYLLSVVPFTSYGGSAIKYVTGKLAGLGESRGGILIGNVRFGRNTEQRIAEVLNQLRSKSVVDRLKYVLSTTGNGIYDINQAAVELYAPSIRGAMDAWTNRLVKKAVDKDISKALAMKHTYQYAANTAGKLVGIGTIEGIEEGVQEILQKDYTAGKYKGYQLPYSIFNVPEVMKDLYLSVNAVADFLGINFGDPYNGDDDIRRAMTIGFFASLGIPAAGGVLNNVRSIAGNDELDSFVNLYRQIKSDKAISPAINQDLLAAAQAAIKDNKIISTLSGEQLQHVLDDEHAGIFFDTLNKKGVTISHLLQSLIDYRNLVDENSLVSKKFIEDDIQIARSVYNAMNSSFIKDYLKSNNLPFGGKEHKELVKDAAQFMIDTNTQMSVMGEQAEKSNGIRKFYLDNVDRIVNGELTQDLIDVLFSEHPFILSLYDFAQKYYEGSARRFFDNQKNKDAMFNTWLDTIDRKKYIVQETYDDPLSGTPVQVEREDNDRQKEEFDSLYENAKRTLSGKVAFAEKYGKVSFRNGYRNAIFDYFDYADYIGIQKALQLVDDQVKAQELLRKLTGVDAESPRTKSMREYLKKVKLSIEKTYAELDKDKLAYLKHVYDQTEAANDVDDFIKASMAYYLSSAAYAKDDAIRQVYLLGQFNGNTPIQDVEDFFDGEIEELSRIAKDYKEKKAEIEKKAREDRTPVEIADLDSMARKAGFAILEHRLKHRQERKKTAHRIFEEDRPISSADVSNTINPLDSEDSSASKLNVEILALKAAKDRQDDAEIQGYASSGADDLLSGEAAIRLLERTEHKDAAREARLLAAVERAKHDAEKHRDDAEIKALQTILEEEEKEKNTAEEPENGPVAEPAEQKPEEPVISVQERSITDESVLSSRIKEALERFRKRQDEHKKKSKSEKAKATRKRNKFGESNKIVTRQKKNSALDFIKAYFSGKKVSGYINNTTMATLIPGINPNIAAALSDVAIFIVEGGINDFVDFCVEAFLQLADSGLKKENILYIAENYFEDLFENAKKDLEELSSPTQGVAPPPQEPQQEETVQQEEPETLPQEQVIPAQDTEATDESAIIGSNEALDASMAEAKALVELLKDGEISEEEARSVLIGAKTRQQELDAQMAEIKELGATGISGVDVDESGAILLDGTKVSDAVEQQIIAELDLLSRDDVSGYVIDHELSSSNTQNEKYSTKKRPLINSVYHTFLYNPQSTQPLKIKDGNDVIKLEHPLASGKQLAEKLLEDKWFENTKKYYVITRYDKNDQDPDSFLIILILDDGEFSYATYLPTLANSKAVFSNLETKLRTRLSIIGTIFEDRKEGQSREEHLKEAAQRLYNIELQVAADLYENASVHNRRPDVIVDQRGAETELSINRRNEWFEKATEYYRNGPKNASQMAEYHKTVERIKELARMRAAKPGERPASNEEIEDAIQALRESRLQIINATLEKVDGKYAFPDTKQQYPQHSRPDYEDASNGSIEQNVKDGEVLFRKISEKDAEGVSDDINNGQIILGIGLGIFSKSSMPGFRIRALGNDGEVFKGKGKSGKVYLMTPSRDKKTLIPVQLIEERFNIQLRKDGSEMFIKDAQRRNDVNVLLTINPLTGQIENDKYKPSAAEVLLYLVCGKQINTADGFLANTSQDDLYKISKVFINNGKPTLLGKKSKAAKHMLAPFASKQIAYYSEEGGKPSLHIALPDWQNGQLIYEVNTFSDEELFSNSEEAIENRKIVISAIASQMHWNTEEDDMAVKFKDGINSSVLRNALKEFFENNKDKTSVQIGGCPQLTFNRDDLFYEHEGLLYDKNVSVAGWMIATKRLYTDTTERMFKDPFVFAHGVAGREIEKAASYESEDTKKGEAVVVSEQKNGELKLNEDFLKRVGNNFRITQTDEEALYAIGKFSGERHPGETTAVLALTTSPVKRGNRVKSESEFKKEIEDSINKWAESRNVGNIEITFKFPAAQIKRSNVPLVRVYNENGVTKATVLMTRAVDLVANNKPITTEVYSKKPGKGKLDEKKARKWLRDTLGLEHENVVVENALMYGCEDEPIFGKVVMVYDAIVDKMIGRIHISGIHGNGIQYHEAWHFVNLLLNTPEQRDLMYASYLIQHPDAKYLTFKEIEENLADEFMDYMLMRDSYSPVKLIKRFFDNVKTLLKATRRKSAYRHVFEQIRKGKFAAKKMDPRAKLEFMTKYPHGANMEGFVPTVSAEDAKNMPHILDYHDFYSTCDAAVNYVMSFYDIRSINDLRLISGSALDSTIEAIRNFADLQDNPSNKERLIDICKNPLAFQNELIARLLKFGIHAKIKKFRDKKDLTLPDVNPNYEPSEEELEENPDITYDRVELELSKKENTALHAKLFMSRIPKLVPREDENGNVVYVNDVDEFGIVKVYSFDEVWGAMLDNLGRCTSFSERDKNGHYKNNSILGECQRLGKSNPIMQSVFVELEKVINPEEFNTSLKCALFGTVNSSKPSLQYIELSDPKNSEKISEHQYMLAALFGSELTNSEYKREADVKRLFEVINDNRFNTLRLIASRWSKQAVLKGLTTLSSDKKMIVNQVYVKGLCDLFGIDIESAKYGRLTPKEKGSFADNIRSLSKMFLGKKKHIAQSEIQDLVYSAEDLLINILNYLGIEADNDVLNTLFSIMMRSDKTAKELTVELKAKYLTLICADTSKKGGYLMSFVRLLAESIGKTYLDTGVKSLKKNLDGSTLTGKPIDELFNRFSQETFIMKLADAYNSQHPSSSEFSVKGPDGKMRYPVSLNNFISDRHRDLNNYEGLSNDLRREDDLSLAARLKKTAYCRHSILVDAALNLDESSYLDDRIKLFAFIGLKDTDSAEGEDYTGMSALEEYIVKMFIVENDHKTTQDIKNENDGQDVRKVAQLLLPIMADKKTYFTIGSSKMSLSHDLVSLHDPHIISPTLEANSSISFFENKVLGNLSNEQQSEYKSIRKNLQRELYIENLLKNNQQLLDEYNRYLIETQSSKVGRYFSENTVSRFYGYLLDELNSIIEYYSPENIQSLIDNPSSVRDNYHGKIKNGRMDFSGNGGKFRYFHDFRTYLDANGTEYNLNQKLEALYKLQKLIENGELTLADAEESSVLRFVPITELSVFEENKDHLDGFELIRAFLKNFKENVTNNMFVAYEQIDKMLISATVDEVTRILEDPTLDLVRENPEDNGMLIPNSLPLQILQLYVDDLVRSGLASKGSVEKQSAWVKSVATYSAIANYVVNMLTSLIEYEKIFHGDPAFYKAKGIKGQFATKEILVDGHLGNSKVSKRIEVSNVYDKFSDKIKRLGGNLSPGQELCLDFTKEELDDDIEDRLEFLDNLDIQNPRQLNSTNYTIAHLDDCMATSNYIETSVRRFKLLTVVDYATSGIINIDGFIKLLNSKNKGKLYNFENVISLLYSKQVVFDQLWNNFLTDEQRENVMENVRQLIGPYTDITVSDAQVFIRPELYRQMRKCLDEWTDEDEEAYRIIETDDSWMTDPIKAAKVEKLSLYPLKMSYFQNDVETLGQQSTAVPAYDKMAIFPMFKFNATTEFSRMIYDRMNRNYNEIDMIAFKSAVKVGGIANGVLTISKQKLDELCYINRVAFEYSMDDVRKLILKMYIKQGMSEGLAKTKASKFTDEKITKACEDYKKSIRDQLTYMEDTFNSNSSCYIDYKSDTPIPRTDAKNLLPVLHQSLRNLRMQLNTQPHSDHERDLGTQFTKIAFQNIIDGRFYCEGKQDRPVRSGGSIRDSIINCIETLTHKGVQHIHKDFFTAYGKPNRKKIRSWILRVAKRNNIGLSAELILNNGNSIASLSSSKLFEQSLIKAIESEVVSIPTNGGTAIQQSVFGFVEFNKENLKTFEDGQGYHKYNGGNELKWVCEESSDGQSLRMGSMEVLLSMNFFKPVIPLDVYSKGYTKQRQWLIDNDIINGVKSNGTNANPKPFGAAYRIPTQGPSSLFAFTVADVMPATSSDLIIVPREFTSQTGSDFDVDKLFIATMSYTDGVIDSLNFNNEIKYIESVGEEYAFSLDKDTFKKNVKQYEKENNLINSESSLYKQNKNAQIKFLMSQSDEAVRNLLLLNIIDIATDDKQFGASRASIDAITNKITSELLPLVQRGFGAYIPSFRELLPSFQMEKKLEFGTGKDGISPFALNQTNMSFTLAAHLSLDYGNNPYALGNLDESIGQDGMLICSYLSAMINAHVDVAKDPYVFAINVNKQTYNHVNLLLRAGKGFSALLFIAQPALKLYAIKANQSKSLYGGNIDGKTPEGGISSISARNMFNQTMSLMVSELKELYSNCKDLTEEEKELYVKVLGYFGKKPSDRTTKISEKDVDVFDLKKQKEALQNYKNDSASYEDQFRATLFLIYSLHAYDYLDKYARKLSKLVHLSQIDTKKMGNTIPLIRNFINRYRVAIKNEKGWVITNDFENSKEKNDALERYFKNTYLHSKLMLTYKLASQMLEGFSFSATKDFNALFDSVMITMFGAVKDENEKTIGYTPVEDEDVVESVARAVESVMKYNAFVLYGSDALTKLGQKDKRQDEGSIDFVSSQSKDLINDIIETAKSIMLGVGSKATSKGSVVERLYTFTNYIIENPDSEVADGLVLDGKIINELLLYLKPFPADEKNAIPHIKLFDSQMLTPSDKKSILMSSFNQLLTHKSDRVRKLARDLCLYAYLSNYDRLSRDSFIDIIPPEFRNQYDVAISIALLHPTWTKKNNDLVGKDDEKNTSLIDSAFIGGTLSLANQYLTTIARNFWYDDNIVPRFFDLKLRSYLVMDESGGNIGVNKQKIHDSKYNFYGAIISSRVRAGNIENPEFFKVQKGGVTVLYKRIGLISVPTKEKSFTKYYVYRAILKAGVRVGGKNMYELYADYSHPSIYSENTLPETWAPSLLLDKINSIVQNTQKRIKSDRQIVVDIDESSSIPKLYAQAIGNGEINESMYYEVEDINTDLAYTDISTTRTVSGKDNAEDRIVNESGVVIKIGESSVLDNDKIIPYDPKKSVGENLKGVYDFLLKTSNAISEKDLQSISDEVKQKITVKLGSPVFVGIIGDASSIKVSSKEKAEYIKDKLDDFLRSEEYSNLEDGEKQEKYDSYKLLLELIAEENIRLNKLNSILEQLVKTMLIDGVKMYGLKTTMDTGGGLLAKASVNAVRESQDYLIGSSNRCSIYTSSRNTRNGVSKQLRETLDYSAEDEYEKSKDLENFISEMDEVSSNYKELHDAIETAKKAVKLSVSGEILTVQELVVLEIQNTAELKVEEQKTQENTSEQNGSEQEQENITNNQEVEVEKKPAKKKKKGFGREVSLDIAEEAKHRTETGETLESKCDGK